MRECSLDCKAGGACILKAWGEQSSCLRQMWSWNLGLQQVENTHLSQRNPQDRIENLKEVPSLVKGREDGIQKDDQARGPILLMGSAECGDSLGDYKLTPEPAPPEFHLCCGHGQGGQEGIRPNSSGLGAPEAGLASYSEVSPEEGQSAARVEGAHTGVLEQDSELQRRERGVSKR